MRARMGLAALLLILCLLTLTGAVDAERAREQAGYEARIICLRGMLEAEKRWIKANQGSGGELYLNGGDGAVGDVNPYFACQAALGLLAGEPSEGDRSAVARYLAWHSARLLEQNGEISNYSKKDGALIPTEKRDSVDGYAALYLTLAAEYALAGGDLQGIPHAPEAIALCAERLLALEEDGLTRVSAENGTRYLMDNAEVYEACRSMERMLEPQDWLGLRECFSRLAENIEAAVEEKLWDDGAGRYAAGIDAGGHLMRFAAWTTFYPDAIAQIYPVSCGLRAADPARERALYDAFCAEYAWERLDLGEAQFPWVRVAYVALALEDVQRVEAYMLRYQVRYALNRSYPFHTAEAGWFARCCGKLLEYYEARRDEGWLRSLLNEMMGEAYGSHS